MTGSRDDDDTPVRPGRARTVSSAVTSWGIVEAWLAADENRRAEQLVDRRGLVVRVHDDAAGACVEELVQPNEDPSVTLVRAIGKMT